MTVAAAAEELGRCTGSRFWPRSSAGSEQTHQSCGNIRRNDWEALVGVEVGLWRIEGRAAIALAESHMPTEQLLEDVLAADISILDSGLLVIGRQFSTPNRKRLDLLAITGDGSLTVIELKRGRTEREVVTQALDYGSWVQTLSRSTIVEMYSEKHGGSDLDRDFFEFFGAELPEELTGEHRLLIVASHLDDETERIVDYLTGFGVPINAVFFRYFEDESGRFLARTWLRDPEDVEAVSSTSSSTKRNFGPWNGTDFYVSFGANEDRDWEDARRLGFVSAGGGRWYTQTMRSLEPGHRVFVRIPGTGYVGVGTVREPARLAKDVVVSDADGSPVSLLEAALRSTSMGHDRDDPDYGEQVVLVDWFKTVPVEAAYHEPGLFGNQNSACRLRDQATIDKVSRHFGVPDVGRDPV